MNIGFIGLGNMSTAIIKGMLRSGRYTPEQITGYAHSDASARAIAPTGINVCREIAAVAAAEVLVLGVKPQVLASVLSELKELIRPEQLLVSLAAGKDLAFMTEQLGREQAAARVMPNINAKVGASASAYACSGLVTPEQKQTLVEIFSTVGAMDEVAEHLIVMHSAVAGASPAFSYMYIDALARAAVKHGIPRSQALKVAASAVYGSARMILESDEHPMALVDQVCSPGGTTIEGVMTLQRLGFEAAVHQAVDAVIAKDKTLE